LFKAGVQALPALQAALTERYGVCNPVPTVFDNYVYTFIRQTFRTGLQTPSSPSPQILVYNDERFAWER